jgi:hypothetical protein
MGGGVQNTMGVQFTIQGGSVFNKGVQYTMDVNQPRVQFTMGFKIPYDTGPPKTSKFYSFYLELYKNKFKNLIRTSKFKFSFGGL